MKHFRSTIKWFAIGLFTLINQNQSISLELPEAIPYITSDFQVTDPVVKLLGLTGIRIENDPTAPQENWPEVHLTLKSRDITEVMEAIQGKKNPKITWLRTANQERWDVTKLSYLSTPLAAQDIFNTLLKDLPQAEAVTPKHSRYDGILVLGSSLPDSFTRIEYLKSLTLNESIPVILLTGERALNPQNHENYNQWMKLTNNQTATEVSAENFPKDEGEMMEMVMQYHQIPYQLHYIKKMPGALRATTQDTIKEWIKSNPKPGKYLVISSQPFVAYQSFVVKRTLLQEFKEKAADYSIETVGLDNVYATESKLGKIYNDLRCFIRQVDSSLIVGTQEQVGHYKRQMEIVKKITDHYLIRYPKFFKFDDSPFCENSIKRKRAFNLRFPHTQYYIKESESLLMEALEIWEIHKQEINRNKLSKLREFTPNMKKFIRIFEEGSDSPYTQHNKKDPQFYFAQYIEYMNFEIVKNVAEITVLALNDKDHLALVEKNYNNIKINIEKICAIFDQYSHQHSIKEWGNDSVEISANIKRVLKDIKAEYVRQNIPKCCSFYSIFQTQSLFQDLRPRILTKKNIPMYQNKLRIIGFFSQT